jgi:pyruvate-formate lyase
MAILTLNQAAKASNKAKSTIVYAIKSGRLSAIKGENGNYEIDTSELFRVYQSNGLKQDEKSTLEHINSNIKTALLEQKLEFLEQRLNKLEQEKNEISHRLEKTELRLENSENERRATQEKLTLLLTHFADDKSNNEPSKKTGKLWTKIFGNKPLQTK